MKKIKFPLLLKNEYPVRNIEELREYFDIEKLYEYFCDGRLLAWLEDHQYEEIEDIKECRKLDKDLAEMLCKIFQVKYDERYSEKMKELQKARKGFKKSGIIGIDLGMTNSCVAVIENGKIIVIKNAEGEMITPSVVAFSKTGEKLVGEPARRQAVTNTERTIFSVKRNIRENNNCTVDGKEYCPQHIYAMVLKKLKEDAEKCLGEWVTEAVIAVPVYFGSLQCQAIKEAAKLAGLDVKCIMILTRNNCT